MAEKKYPRLTDVIGLINRLAPPHLAEEWDNVGLQVGDPNALIRRVLVCLDAEKKAVDEAVHHDAQMIITHHPLIFRPLKRLTPGDSPGNVIFHAVRNEIAVVAAHTNLDRTADGLNDWLAEQIGLSEIVPLEQPAANSFYKLVVFVPIGHEESVMEALFAAGAGHIGAYDRCSFRTPGIGTFRGNAATNPFIGIPDAFEQTEELRLETIIPATQRERIVTRMIKAHPYEEVAYDLIPLANPDRRAGLGRIGMVQKKTTLGEFARQVQAALSVPALRLVGALDRPVGKVAVCGGAGMVAYGDAVRRGADCLVTGDVKFHEAQRARAEGVALIDAGHFATEKIMIARLAAKLAEAATTAGYDLKVIEMTTEEDPFFTIT